VTVLRPALFEGVSDLIAAVSPGRWRQFFRSRHEPFVQRGDRSEDVTENRQRFFGTLGIHVKSLPFRARFTARCFAEWVLPARIPIATRS